MSKKGYLTPFLEVSFFHLYNIKKYYNKYEDLTHGE